MTFDIAGTLPAHDSPRLSASNLRVGYGDTVILRDLSLDIPDGAITVLLGPNGCGKSTLLKSMVRVLPLISGEVRLDGAPVHATPTREVARKMALLPQGPVAPEGLLVRELVAQGRHPHQSFLRQWSREDARAVETAMKAADITEFADRPLADLSGGQRQRCWVAMVLAQETDIILLDEPTTFLDLKVQVDLMQLLRRIAHTEGRTLVVVLHELNIAAAFADHLVMMKAGGIVTQGPVETAFTSGTLKDVFDLEATILTDPGSGRPVCVPMVAGQMAVAAQ